ncbi:MAG: leukotriene A4 hydrolase C-terminal domain-containing protein [Bacteroidia bacterium]
MFLRMLEQTYGREKSGTVFERIFQYVLDGKQLITEQFLEYLNTNLVMKHPNLTPNIKEWVYEIGLPKNSPKIVSKEFSRVEKMADSINLNKNLNLMDTTGFTTHHWLHLLRNLQKDSIKPLMATIDSVYHLTASTNSEIQCDWYQICIQNQYHPADSAIESYLLNVGRRKFLKPIYTAYSKTPEGLKKGREIYRKAENSYHSVSRNTIRDILKLN